MAKHTGELYFFRERQIEIKVFILRDLKCGHNNQLKQPFPQTKVTRQLPLLLNIKFSKTTTFQISKKVRIPTILLSASRDSNVGGRGRLEVTELVSSINRESGQAWSQPSNLIGMGGPVVFLQMLIGS